MFAGLTSDNAVTKEETCRGYFIGEVPKNLFDCGGRGCRIISAKVNVGGESHEAIIDTSKAVGREAPGR